MEMRKYFTRQLLPSFQPSQPQPREEASIPGPELDLVLTRTSVSDDDQSSAGLETRTEPLQKRVEPFPFHKVHYYQPPARKRPARRLALVLTLLVNGLTLSLLSWVFSACLGRAKSPEMDLHTAGPSSTVIATSAKEPVLPPPVPEKIQVPTLEEKTPVAAPLVLVPEPELKIKPVPPPPDVVVPPPPAEMVPARKSEPLANALWQPYLVFTQPHGETPMLRNWKMLQWASALAAVVTLTPVAFAQEDVKTLSDRLDKLEKNLTDKIEKAVGEKVEKNLQKVILDTFKNMRSLLEKDIEDLRAQVLAKDLEFEKTRAKLDQLEKLVIKIGADLEVIKNRLADKANSPMDKALDELKIKLEAIEKALEGPKVVVKSPAATGRVVLVNLCQEEMLFVINGRSFRVPPNTNLPVEGLAAGSLTYEVLSPTWGRRALRTTTLNPNETLTLTARY